jgi:hypothetical protein
MLLIYVNFVIKVRETEGMNHNDDAPCYRSARRRFGEALNFRMVVSFARVKACSNVLLSIISEIYGPQSNEWGL